MGTDANQGQIPHPGIRIKSEVIPKGMTVTRAAELIGVSRPTLSNLLNGNSALTPEMAARLERAFNFPRAHLMQMQADYEAAGAEAQEAPEGVSAYVPSFLGIRANQIEAWVNANLTARARLAVFLRTLVNSTGKGLTKVDFPGNDDAERAGPDGSVEATGATPWISAGVSTWEFGTNENVKKKADDDYAKSTESFSDEERKKITFVFVTPRRWHGKEKWVANAKGRSQWKDVRAYDAADLEQWLEQSLAGQTWFANETNVPSQGVRSLDKCWKDWASVATPPIAARLFEPAIESAKRTIQSRLSKQPEGPTIIVADSAEEALAFLAQLFGERGGDELSAYRDRTLVFDEPGVIGRLTEGAQDFIPVAYSRDVERELAPHVRARHSIIIYPRNASNVDPHITLEPVGYEVFKKSMEDMGKTGDEVDQLAAKSGRSLTVLRRQLSHVPAVKTPEWAERDEVASLLVPFLMVGAWNSLNETDKIGLSLLAGDRPYEVLEKECQRLTRLNDAPLWSIGTLRGVVSKIDLLFAIAGVITREELDRFFVVAKIVLGEDDPALDLAEEDRWAAAIYKKTREFSRPFRDGVSETLVLLAVYGNGLFKRRQGVDCEHEAGRVVRELLPVPLTVRRLEANNHDLPLYAEAAPDEFLSIIEADLKSEDPAVLHLLRPVNSSVFGLTPNRTGLLWALESLSWNVVTLRRTVPILARLAQIEINDNWVNKPINSLEAIFRAWMPQTAASHEVRAELMRQLQDQFPDVAWQICVAQFGGHGGVGHHSHKPRWRADGFGHGEPHTTWGPINRFVREMVEMAIHWKVHSLSTLSDLIGRIDALSEEHQSEVWGLVKTWSAQASDKEKSSLREKIRVSTLSNRAVRRSKKTGAPSALSSLAKEAYDALAPRDLLNQHSWLFKKIWVEESYDELHGEVEEDFQKRDARIEKLRVDALGEIFRERGETGVLELAASGETSWQIGWLCAKNLMSEEELTKFLGNAMGLLLTSKEDVFSLKNVISGALHAIDDESKREVTIRHIASSLDEESRTQLLLLAPFRRTTWMLAGELDGSDGLSYWRLVHPDLLRDSDDELSEAVSRLMKVNRPRAAFSTIRFQLEKIDASVLHRLLLDIAKGGDDKPGEYQVENYNLESAFKIIDKSLDLSLEQKAGLEFAYIDALTGPGVRERKSSIPNLERYVELHPEVFVQAIVWTYKRRGDGEDPPELRVKPGDVEHLASRGYKLLEGITRIPGHDDLGELTASGLAKWVKTVRASCAELGRAEVGDVCIGKLLAAAPVGSDGVWPIEPVRQVLEELRSRDVMSGAHTGLYNARGVHWRGEGGDQERELANKYRKWADALMNSHPFVATELLMDMVRTYEHEAEQHDSEAAIRRRLR